MMLPLAMENSNHHGGGGGNGIPGIGHGGLPIIQPNNHKLSGLKSPDQISAAAAMAAAQTAAQNAVNQQQQQNQSSRYKTELCR